MHPDRLRHLYQENKDDNGEYILYWMQRSQRVNYNHCLSHAIRLANANKLPLVVVFNLTNSFLGASSAHFIFMIEGLKEVKDNLEKLGINFIIKVGNFTENISNLAAKSHTTIFDFAYLREERKWRREVYEQIVRQKLAINIDLVESDVIVPVEKAYDKVAYGAYVLRPHLNRLVNDYLDFDFLAPLENKNNYQ